MRRWPGAPTSASHGQVHGLAPPWVGHRPGDPAALSGSLVRATTPGAQDTSGVVACPEGDPVEGGADDDPNVSSITCNAQLHHETMLLYPGWGRWGHQMAGTDGGRLHGLVDEQTVYAALDAIDEALEQPLIAPTEHEQRWQLNQLRGLLLILRSGDLSLEDCLRRLIRLLRTPMIDR